jgi:WD40 repeat protein
MHRLSGILVPALVVFMSGESVPGADGEPAKKPAAEATQKQDGDSVMRQRFTLTDKDDGTYRPIGKQGVFFGADGETLYVRRNGGRTQVQPIDNALPTGTLSLWSLSTQKKIGEIVGCQEAMLSPSGKTLAVIGVFKNKNGAPARLARLVDPRSAEVIQETQWKDGPGMITQFGRSAPLQLLNGPVVFAPDGKRLVIFNNLDLLVWDFKAKTVARRGPTASALPFGVVPFGILPDGKSLLAFDPVPEMLASPVFKAFPGRPGIKASKDEIIVWDLVSNRRLRAFQGSGIEFGISVLAPDGKTAASPMAPAASSANPKGQLQAALTSRLGLWSVQTGKVGVVCDPGVPLEPVPINKANKQLARVPARPAFVSSAAFAPDSRIVAACTRSGEGGYVHLFETRSGKILASAKIAYGPEAIAFSRDGALLAIAGADGPLNLTVWDVTAVTGPSTK